MKFTNNKLWVHNLQKYKGLWIAFEEDEKTILASHKNAKIAYSEALGKQKGIPIMFKVPTLSVPYVG